LRARLTASVAAVVLIAVAVAFTEVYRSTDSQLSAEIDRSVRGNAVQLAHAITEKRSASPQSVLATARRYAATQPYNGSAVLLFVLVPGIGTASNHPELFGSERRDDGETSAEQRAENAQGRKLARPRPGYSTQLAPDTGPVRVFQARLTVDGRAIYAGAGETLNSVEAAEAGVTHSFVLAGALTLLLGVLCAYLIGSRISDPIRRAAAVAAQIDAGDLGPRIVLSPGAAEELQVLADAFNHMLDRLAHAFAAQREFVADASHELRTPLTVIRGQLDVLVGSHGTIAMPERADIERVEHLIQAEISRLTRLVDDLLLLAQSDRDDFLHLTDVRLDELVTELWDGLSLTAERNFELGSLEPVTVIADPDRLAQALRNLAGNAITHTSEPHGLVRVDVERSGQDVARVTVSDDGPGISPELRAHVFERFYRTDPARTRAAGGAGLGLAIVQAITEAHHGSVKVGVAAAGGAMFQLDLPIRAMRNGAPPARP
jgi:two-component system OmpR family sensor kinase